jgi:predicted permease
MNLRDLFLRIRALVARRRVERELDEELAFHIERETQKHIAAGLSPVDARARALARFGPVPLAADQCRDARGVGFVDDLTRDVLYAFRTFRRAPLAALTVIATVAFGLGLVAVVFTVYNFLFLRVDAVRSPGELFAVKLWRPADSGTDDKAVSVARPDYEAMRGETGVFTDLVATRDEGPPSVDGRLARPVLVTGNFFQVLGVQAALGRPLVPEDDDRFEGRPVIVLSHVGWHKLFQGDRGVIGRRVMISGATHEIVGVMPDGFRGLAVAPPDYWLPLALAGQFHDASTWREGGIEVIGRLKPGVSPQAAAAALSAWASGRAEFKTPTMRPIQVSLLPRQGTLSSDGAGIVFGPLFFAFGLILMIACANVANLLLARGVSRQREIGTRLSLGASRRRIVRQLLTESLILSLAAAVCGVVVAQLFLDSVLQAVITTLPPEIARLVGLLNVTAPTADWRVLVFLLVGAIASTVFFGLAPALQATRLDLVRTMRGEVTRDARPRRARHALITVQVGASALLLICAAIFLRGAVAAATKDPGVRTSDTVIVNIDDESKRGALLQSLLADPLVAAVAASSRSTRGVVETSVSPSRMSVDQMGVSSEYFNVLGLPLVRGRSFTQAERTAEVGGAVMSETIARQLWPNGDGIGQVVRLEIPQLASPDILSLPSRTLTVVGVVRDPGPGSVMGFRGVYLPTGPESPGTDLMLRVRGNPEQARLALLERLTGVDPVFGVMTLRTISGLQTYMLRVAFSVTIVLGGLALVLTVSGLFSVLSYVVEQQAKEIGVRMALGAAMNNVVRWVLFQSLRPVGIGLAAGGGLAAAVAIVLMATPIAAEIGGSVDVLDPVAYGAGLLVIVASCALAVTVPALRAARIDPITTLRRE